MTLLALRQGVDLADAEALARIAQDLRIEVTRPTAPDGRQYTVLVNGEDVTWALRAPEVDAAVSAVSAVPAVRQAAYHHLRRLISPQGTVMVGRDIGTVVMPDADLKLYLSASPESRAARRAAELQARGQPGDYDFILRDQYRRDAYDGSRATAPMRPAEDALVLVNDDLDVEAEVALVLQHLDRQAATTEAAREGTPTRDRHPLPRLSASPPSPAASPTATPGTSSPARRCAPPCAPPQTSTCRGWSTAPPPAAGA